MAGTLPPIHELTAIDQGGAVVVVAYSLVSITILFSVVRLATTRVLKRAFGFDDIAVVVATAFALAQSIVVEHAVDSGLGRHQSSLSAGQLSSYYKLSFAASMLAIVAMLFAKVSVLVLILRVSPPSTFLRRSCYGSIWACVGWAVFSILALAVQCDVPKTWIYEPQRCASQGAVWYPIIVLNILTDLAATFLFFPALRKLQMHRTRLIMLGFLFGSRLLTCVAEIAQLALAPHALESQDQTWSSRMFVILSLVVMNTSIITANIPPLSKLLSGIHVGDGARIPDLVLEISGNGSHDRTSKATRMTFRQASRQNGVSGNSGGSRKNQSEASGESKKGSVASQGGITGAREPHEVPDMPEK